MLKSIVGQGKYLMTDFSRSSSQVLTVQTVRMAFLAIVLSVTVIYQVINSAFIPFDIFFSVYSLLALSFVLNCVYIIFLDKALSNWYYTAFLFVWETLYISLLIYYIGVNQSLLVFLYLINIILCGVVFQRRGGIYLAIVTSIAFSLTLALDPQVQGNALYLAVGMNNLAFFTVAYLSGYLSEQLNFMGVELKERGKDIRVLKNLNTLILDSMSTGLLTVDNDGQILQSNSVVQEILSLDKSLVDKNLRNEASVLFNAIDNSVAKSTKEIVYKDSLGVSKNLRIHMSPLTNEQNIRKGLILVIDDITDIRKLESRVQQSEKMAAIGQLAAGIAHEIRNPLASISGSIQLLKSDQNGSPEEQKLMSIVLKEISRLDNLINEFLDFARPQPPLDETVDLEELLKEIIDAIKYDPISKDVDFKLSLQTGIKIKGHKDKLKQALWNIIRNGLQAMEDVSRKTYTIELSQSGAGIDLKMKDTGIGIPEDRLQKIFEPFHTTKQRGTGLGLAVVHAILDAHKAEIDVSSEEGSGTEFHIHF